MKDKDFTFRKVGENRHGPIWNVRDRDTGQDIGTVSQWHTLFESNFLNGQKLGPFDLRRDAAITLRDFA